MDSPLLACFDPLALDMLRDLLPASTPFEVAGLLERVNVNHPFGIRRKMAKDWIIEERRDCPS